MGPPRGARQAAEQGSALQCMVDGIPYGYPPSTLPEARMSRVAVLLLVLSLLAPAAAGQLGGLYTINPIAPTAGTNYGSLAAAVSGLARSVRAPGP